jgi:16S rRNA (cytosine1402-N4)-methyltransferase
MVPQVLEHLEPARGGVFIDCTVGLGGHAAAILEAGASRLLGFDRDPAALEIARERLAARDSGSGQVELVHGDYRQLAPVLAAHGMAAVDGILADLGVSSLQLDEARGFSFRRDEPLDMRMDTTAGPTAAEAIRSADEQTLADVIYRFGEERHARRVARAIAAAGGAITTTGQLADIVRRAIPRKGFSRIDPATRTFQAIRIWVNRELEQLDAFIADAARLLAPGGRLVVISFHSLEDRIVKHTLRALQADGTTGLTIRTKRPIVPDEAELERNPRARSAKLRAAQRNERAAS